MKHKPHSLTSSVSLTALALLAVVVAISPLSPVSVFGQQGTDAQAAKLTRSSLTATQVFEGIGEKLEGLDSLSCDIRQTVVVKGQRFQAAGKYVHASGNRMRLEYRIFPIRSVKASDKETFALDGESADTSELKITGSLQQVSDGSVLWSLWVNGDQRKLTRRNIREIVEVAEGIPNYSKARSLQDLGVGGLQTLMTQLQAGMDFGAVREQQAKSGRFLVLSGRWSEKIKKDVFQVPDDPEIPLPDFIPDYVVVYVDAATMLPRRIQYLKKHPDPEQKRVRPMVTLDFRNISPNAEITDQTFEFVRPDGEKITEIDLTSQVIESIKQIAKENSSEDATEKATDGSAGAEPDNK